MYKERTLPSGEIIALSDENPYTPKGKPFEVSCCTETEVRWAVHFATIEEAEKEYARFG